MSVRTETANSFFTAASTRNPSISPGPRNDDPDVRLALSYDALKMKGMASRLAVSTSRLATAAVCASLSMTNGPATGTIGLPPPIPSRSSVTTDTAQATDSAVDLGTPAVLCLYAASTNEANSGCGLVGLERNSGWNWTARYHGCPGNSAISANLPSGDRPVIFRPCWARGRS